MHRSVGQNLIFSQVVREAVSDTKYDIVSLGRYMLRGVSEPFELFTIYRPQGEMPHLVPYLEGAAE